MAASQLQSEALAARMARARFLYGLSKVPDDRLNWKPSETAKSPLQIAGTLVGFLTFLQQTIASKSLPPMDGGEQSLPTTREEVNTLLEQAFDGMIAGIESLSPEDLSIPLPAPWMPGVPLTLGGWIGMALGVCSYFQGQMNYAQTVYSDMDPNLPENWGVS